MRRTLLFLDHDDACRKFYDDMFVQDKDFRAVTFGIVDTARDYTKKNGVHLIIASRPAVGYAIQNVLDLCRQQALQGKRRVLLVGAAYNDNQTVKRDLNETGARAVLPKKCDVIPVASRLVGVLIGCDPRP